MGLGWIRSRLSETVTTKSPVKHLHGSFRTADAFLTLSHIFPKEETGAHARTPIPTDARLFNTQIKTENPRFFEKGDLRSPSNYVQRVRQPRVRAQKNALYVLMNTLGF